MQTLPGAVISRSWLKNSVWYCSYLYSLMQTLPGAVISRSWLKKIPSCIAAIKRVRQFVPPPSNIASYLQSLDLAAFWLLQCCLGKLWRKTSRQTSKTSKIVQSSNFLKLWRRCIRPVPKFKLEKSYYSASYPIKDLNVNLIKIRACEVGSRSQLTLLLLAASWSQQTSDHSDKISLLIANLKVATLRLEFVNNDTTPPLLLCKLPIKLRSLCSFHANREN